MGISSPANRPDPDGPGGLGAEESGTERTGPTQDFVVARQRGGRWAEVGQQYDSANDPVTRYFRISRVGTIGRACGGILQRASCSVRRLAQSCSPDDRRRFMSSMSEDADPS